MSRSRGALLRAIFDDKSLFAGELCRTAVVCGTPSAFRRDLEQHRWKTESVMEGCRLWRIGKSRSNKPERGGRMMHHSRSLTMYQREEKAFWQILQEAENAIHSHRSRQYGRVLYIQVPFINMEHSCLYLCIYSVSSMDMWRPPSPGTGNLPSAGGLLKSCFSLVLAATNLEGR